MTEQPCTGAPCCDRQEDEAADARAAQLLSIEMQAEEEAAALLRRAQEQTDADVARRLSEGQQQKPHQQQQPTPGDGPQKSTCGSSI